MKVALAQLNPKIGAVEENLKKAQKLLVEAKSANVELLVFPELTFLGYPPRDLLENQLLIEQNSCAAETLGKDSQGITVIVSVALKNPNAKEKPLFNVAQVWQDGKIIFKYKKRLFPYYDIFDEERHFESGTEKGLFSLGEKKVALTICEDIWGVNGKSLAVEFITDKPDLMVNLSASPFEAGKPHRRETLVKEIARKLNCPVLYCNQTGANDELLFDGASLIVSAEGNVEARLPVFEEKLLIHNLGKTGVVTPYPTTNMEWHYQGLVTGIRDYFQKTNNTKVILGLSGGIDSSVVAALAREAVGPNNIKGIALPSKYNASSSLEDAKTLATNLGIEFETISIEPLVEAFLKQLSLSGVALENIQPRIRMTVLMAKANQENRILLNTSNKSEIACGYATLYGDSAGALAVIGDLKKHEVYALAEFINRNKEIIPRRVIDRAPSAELRENQTDQDTLPEYSVLDKIVELFIERGMSPPEIEAQGVDLKSLDTFLKLYRGSEYKRRQLPPVLRVTGKAFGMGRRIPVVGVI